MAVCKSSLTLEAVERLESITDALPFEEFEFEGKGYLIKLNEMVIGAIQTGFDSTESTYVLDQFEILPAFRGQGYGTEAIEKLKALFPQLKSIKGLSHLQAVGFWQTQDVEFEDTCVTCSYDECPFHPNYVEPEEEDEFACTDYCDDYSPYHFTLRLK